MRAGTVTDPPPVWELSASAQPAFAPLRASAQADVAVIGAGYSGLSCAMRLAELGASVVVLEARQPGAGASGRNAGQWLPGWAGRTPQQIEHQFGTAHGRALNQFNLEASRMVPELVRRYGIETHLRQSGILLVAHTRNKLAELHRTHAYWCALGASVTLLKRAEIAAYLNTGRYFGGLLLHDAGSLNPLAYARGLAGVAQRMGVVIHGDSRVEEARLEGDHWCLCAGGATLRAARLAVCTDASPTGIWPLLDASYYRLPLTLLATEVLADAGRSFMPGGVPFADTNALSLFGGMLDCQGRFVTSLLPQGRRDSCTLQAHARCFDAKFRDVFGASDTLPWRYRWSGHVGTVPDAIPRMYRLGPGAMAILGYSGAGIALATALGRELAGVLLGADPQSCVLPIVEPRRLPFAAAAPLLFRHVVAPLARFSDRFY